MSASTALSLPSYLEQPPEVQRHLAELKTRPVVLGIDKLGKDFVGARGPVSALSEVSFDVHKKEFVSVIGPSGCGKSTLIRILAGLEAPTRGRVLLDGASVHGPGAERGMVFQGYTLFPWLTVQDNVMFGPRLRGLGKGAARAKAHEWLELVGLTKFAEHYPDQLSGGMKQRVAIARTLINRPRLVLMDEPFGALDPQTRWGMQSLLLDVSRTEDNTTLFVTHDVSEAVYLGDTVYVLSNRPARILHRVDVPYFPVRDAALKSAAEFRVVEKQLLDLLYAPQPRST
jgi:NitT/TauT family transport system ATP-binding protein